MVSFLISSAFRARSRLDTYHTQVLAADITPTLERLREEKSHYLRWSANAAEVSRLERFCVAAEYDEAEKAAEVSGEGAAKAEQEAQALEKEASDKAEEAEAKKAQEQKCRAKDGAAGLASQRRKELKKAVDDASTEVARLEAAQKGAQTAFDADDSRLKGEAENAADNERIESAKKEEVALCEQAVAKCSTEKDEADQAFQNAETVHKEALAGKGTTDTKSVSEQRDLGVPLCRDAFTPSMRVVSGRAGGGWSLFRL